MNAHIERITTLQVNDALKRIEKDHQDDANLLRAYIRKLETLLAVYQIKEKKVG
jgi:hypothetical protein